LNTSFSDTTTLFKLKPFRNYIFFRFVLIFGLYAQVTVISYHLYSITHNVLSLGYVAIAEVIPAFVFSLFAGHIADKYEKRMLLLCTMGIYLFSAVLLFFITSQYAAHNFSVHLISIVIFIATFIGGIGRAFIAPVGFSLLPQLVPADNYSKAISWSSTSWYLGSVIGPLVGAWVLAKSNINWAIIMVIAFLIMAFILSFNFKKYPSIVNLSKEKMSDSLKQGIQFVFKTPIILAVLSLDLFAVLFGGAEALLPVFAKDILQVGETGFGWLRSAHGIGSIVCVVLLSFVPIKKNMGIKLLFSVAAFGLCMMAFGISANFYLSLFVIFMGGFFDNISVIARHTILQQRTPAELKGRVASVNSIFISSSNEIGAFESTMAARYLGLVPGVVVGGIITIGVVIVTALKSKELKEYQG
jgi:MFS family permease